jgi:3'-phosphoadenosine 5'-phosphosulfate sulfotransferase (PAPS reductase)/FAD synthetase
LPDWSALARHERVAVNFSGGKDSLAVCHLLREAGLLDRVTIYHNSTGDLLPEVREVVESVKAFAPRFVHIQGDVLGWIAQHGLPSDLVPFHAHEVGQIAGQGAPVASRYDCCYANLMRPLWERVKADGNTLIIRGTRKGDFPRLPVTSGQTAEGCEFLHPIEDWSADDVFAYLRKVGAPICRVYEEGPQSPECARCTAWMNVGTGRYLKRHHPDLYADYKARLTALMGSLAPVLETYRREVAEVLANDASS